MNLNQLINKYQGVTPSDVKLLLEKVLDTTYSKLLLADSIHLSEIQNKQLSEYVERLKNNEPVQYILGQWEFIDLSLKVDKRALIPRPETEILAQTGVALAQKFDNPKVLDIGCGTGCIGLYIKHKLPDAKVTLCDISKDAISLAKVNAKKLGLDVEFIHMDMKDITGTYDIIVSNPPYITAEDMQTLDRSVIDFEPENALCGGADGMEFYKLLTVMHKNLSNCGYLAMELGIGQSEAVSNLLKHHFEDIALQNDFAGIPRVISARKA